MLRSLARRIALLNEEIAELDACLHRSWQNIDRLRRGRGQDGGAAALDMRREDEHRRAESLD